MCKKSTRDTKTNNKHSEPSSALHGRDLNLLVKCSARTWSALHLHFTMLLTMNVGFFMLQLAESIAKSPSAHVDEAGILIACKRDLHAGPQALLLSAVINFAP